MNQLIIIILNNSQYLPEILKRWRDLGVPGATVLKSEGGLATEKSVQGFSIESLANLLPAQVSANQRTILSVVDTEELLESAVAEAEEVVGGFDRPGRGLLFVVPLSRTLGLIKWGAAESEDQAMDEEDHLTKYDRSTPVSEVIHILDLEPVIVPADGTLEEAFEGFLVNPRVKVASIVNESGHLVGLLDSMDLTDGLLFNFFPEEFMADLDDLERVIKVASKSQDHRVSDLMKDPVSVNMDDTIKDAFHLLHHNKLNGLPVVDDHYHVIGHINLMELLAVGVNKMPSSEDPEANG